MTKVKDSLSDCCYPLMMVGVQTPSDDGGSTFGPRGTSALRRAAGVAFYPTGVLGRKSVVAGSI